MSSFDPNHQQHESILQMIANRILFCPAEEHTAREIQSLSREERSQLWADMTGAGNEFRDKHAESPDLIEYSLQQLEQELQRIPDSQKQPYLIAESVNNGQYTSNQTLRLAFLRSENFDPAATAQRFVAHFDAKWTLFAPTLGVDGNKEFMGRQITLNDLTEDDLQALRCGGMQVLPRADACGRTVIFTRQHFYDFRDRDNMVRFVSVYYGFG